LKQDFINGVNFKEGYPEPSIHGFPMSDYVKDRKIWIGRNARTLAAQPVAKIADETKVFEFL